jgi:hypothetical protein
MYTPGPAISFDLLLALSTDRPPQKVFGIGHSPTVLSQHGRAAI